LSIKIVSITYFKSELKRFRDFAIDDIEPGNIYRNFLLIRGWVLCTESLVIGIELIDDQSTSQFIAISEVRLDVANHRPDRPGAEYSGFRKMLNLADWISTTELTLQAVLANGNRILLCKLKLETIFGISDAMV
jgi:hypothetical protein